MSELVPVLSDKPIVMFLAGVLILCIACIAVAIYRHVRRGRKAN